MKKIVLLSLMVMCLPLAGIAQSFDDDLYYSPKEDKVSTETDTERKATEKRVSTPASASASSGINVVVKDPVGNVRSVDEYNRRYDARDNEFSMEDDTLVVQKKALSDRGEWMDGFDGSQDDYEYAMRIVRFRNPRYAIPLSSPLYWDVMYGLNSWDWNVYNDGFYAYAFPTFSNNLWFDWRFGSMGLGFGWGGGYPYYGGWGGYYPGSWGWGGGWGHHHHGGGWCDPWYGGGSYYQGNSAYYNTRRNTYNSSNRYSSDRVSTGSYSRPSSGRGTSIGSGMQSARPSSGRVVGTRPSSGTSIRPGSSIRPSDGVATRPSSGSSSSSRPSSSYTRPSSSGSGSSSYTRPSGTRRSSAYSPSESSTRSSSGSTYNRGSSSSSRPSSNYNNSSRSSSRSYDNSSSRSYSSPSSGSSRSSGSYSSGGGSSSRSSGGGGGSSRSSSGRR